MKTQGKVSFQNLMAPSFYRALKDIQNSRDTDQKSPTYGKPLREYFFRGGRGCVDGDTLISTPQGDVKIRDFKGGEIYAFDGTRIITAIACSPIQYTEEDLYEVSTQSGAKIVCTSEHRFLVDRGWKAVKHLSAGDSLYVSVVQRALPQAFDCDTQDRPKDSYAYPQTPLACVPCAPGDLGLSSSPSLSKTFSDAPSQSQDAGLQSVSYGGALRLIQRLVGLLYHYWQDCRQCDGLPPSDVDTYQDVLLRLTDAPVHTHSHSKKDGLASVENDSQTLRCVLRPSMLGCLRHKEGIYYGDSENQNAQTPFEWLFANVQEVERCLSSGDHCGSIQQVASLLLESICLHSYIPDREEAKNTQEEEYILQMLSDTLRRNVHDDSLSSSYCGVNVKQDGCIRTPHVMPDNVVSIKKAKRGRYWDMFVPFYNNYISNGVISHNSTKSSFISLRIVSHIIENPLGNAVVFVRVAENIRDSVYKQIIWAIDHLQLSQYFKCTTSPFRCEYLPTGQEILFRGLDKSGKIKGIKPTKGYFDTIWFEELTEFNGMEDVRSVIQSVLRGTDEDDSEEEGTGEDVRTWEFYSYNPPPTIANWVNIEASTPVEGRKVYSSNYLTVNPKWLGKEFFRRADALRKRNKRAYMHEYLGYVTGTGGNVFNNVITRKIKDEEITSLFNNRCFGIDWGFTTDPFVWLAMHFDTDRMVLYIFDEIYEHGLRTQQSAEKVRAKMARFGGNIPILADCAEPDSIADFNAWGIHVEPCPKPHGMTWSGRDYSIKALSDLNKIVIDPEYCPNAAREFLQYEFQKNANGEFLQQYPKKNDHCFPGDTLVRTRLGDVPIASLVGKSGEVLSYDEKTGKFTWCDFYNCSMTYAEAETVIVELEDGRKVECTEDHKILTANRGWVDAGKLTGNDEIMCL